MSAAALFSAAADALAKQDDAAAEAALTQAADAVAAGYPNVAEAARRIRDSLQSCDLIRRRRITAIVDCQQWAADFAEAVPS